MANGRILQRPELQAAAKELGIGEGEEQRIDVARVCLGMPLLLLMYHNVFEVDATVHGWLDAQ
jgi:ABC-type transport system involved in Fe-S cluster assembly fused permease/ATPase subunit